MRGGWFLSRVLAVAGGMLVALLLLEGGIRVAGVRPRRLEPVRYEGWDGMGWVHEGTWGRGTIKRPSPFPEVEMGEYVPGARFRIVYADDPRGVFDKDHSVPVRINALGLRGPEIETAKAPGVLRILALGDSFTMGAGVRDDETWPAQLERTLRTARTAVEVLNAGVGGYNTRDEALYLERRWLPLSPDLVVIGFFLNDAYSESTFLNNGEDLGITAPPLDSLARSSRLWDLVRHRVHRARIGRSVGEFYRRQYFTDAAHFLGAPGEKTVDWQDARRSLARVAELGRLRGFGSAVVIWPHLFSLDRHYPFEEIHRVVADECRSLGIPVLDLLDTFRGRRAADLWVHETDHHPNAGAQADAARAIAAFLRGNPVLFAPGKLRTPEG